MKSTDPWLSLMARSWALAGAPDTTKYSSLASLEASIVNLAKNAQLQNPDPNMQNAVEGIRTLLSSMMVSINVSNSEAQTNLDEKGEAVRQCKPPSSNFTSPPITSQSVVDCRNTEQTAYEDWQACLILNATCEGTSECCADVLQPHEFCNVMPAITYNFGHVCSSMSPTSTCSTSDVSAALAYFRQKQTEYQQALQACKDSVAGCPNRPGWVHCDSQEVVYNRNNTHCDNQQQVFEQHYCNEAANFESAWENYTSCYNMRMAILSASESVEHANLPNQRSQYRAILRIQCLLQVLETTGGGANSTLQQCIDARSTWSIDFPWINISYPSLDPTFPSLANCSTPLWEPGISAFVTYFYNNNALMEAHLPKTAGCVAKLSTHHCQIQRSVPSLLLMEGPSSVS